MTFTKITIYFVVLSRWAQLIAYPIIRFTYKMPLFAQPMQRTLIECTSVQIN